MKNEAVLWMTLSMAAGTILTRFLPFLIFPEGRKIPGYVEYLGRVLPYAAMGLLVVYLSEGGNGFFLALRTAGVSGFGSRSRISCLEEKFSSQHWGRNRLLYDPCAGHIYLAPGRKW